MVTSARTCVECGRPFPAQRTYNLYCSRACQQRGWRAATALAGTHGPGRTAAGNFSWVRLSPVRAPIWNATKEAEWRKLVLGWAARGGWRSYFTWRSDHSPAGFPDLVICKPPRLLIIELKRERRYPTPAQREWLADLRACGLQAEVWYPHDEERVRAILLEDAA